MESVVSVNLGMPAQLPYRDGFVLSGITKSSVDSPAMLRAGGFDGDGQADRTVHGGEYKAAYIYSADDYEWWKGELGRDLAPGTFGENLTVTGLTDHDVRVGDILQIGAATVAVASPREPCFKLGIHMGDPLFVMRFRDAGRMGFYVRVVNEGVVIVGDPVQQLEMATGSITVAEFHSTYIRGRSDVAALGQLLAVPGLEPSWVQWCQRRISELSSSRPA